MLLDELLEQLSTTPGTARAVVIVDGSPTDVDDVVYQGGEVLIRLDRDISDDADDDDDGDDDWEDDDTMLQSVWRIRLRRAFLYLHNGVHSNYPLCCVVFFTFVWNPLQRSRFRHRLARLFDVWITHRRTEQIPCPWHQLGPRGSSTDETPEPEKATSMTVSGLRDTT